MEQNLTFADLGLSEEILQALEKKGYGYPTRIQAEAIPEFMQWKDVIAKAPTGTGKTFAFGIPMIEHIDAESEDLQGLILAPTRELAIQICDELRGLLTYYKNIRVAVVYGGAKIEGQIKQLKNHPQIVVATPGRLMDHYKRHTLSFDKVQTVVLDEADRMLDMGFFDDVTKIIEKVKNRRNLGLFSATISQEVTDCDQCLHPARHRRIACALLGAAVITHTFQLDIITFGYGSCDSQIALHDAFFVLALFKVGQHLLVLDPSRQSVGQNAFQTVTDFDPRLSVIDSY